MNKIIIHIHYKERDLIRDVSDDANQEQINLVVESMVNELLIEDEPKF